MDTVDFWKNLGIVLGAVTALITTIVAVVKLIRNKVVKPIHAWFEDIEKSLTHIHDVNNTNSISYKLSEINDLVQMSGARVMIIMDEDSQAIYECSPEGLCIFANRTLCELFDLSLAEMTGTGWLQALAGPERERVYDVWTSAVKKKIPYECVYVLKNKQKVYTKATPMLDRLGNVLGYHGRIWAVQDTESNE